MIFAQSCVQFGGGRMGAVWVDALSEYFESVALVDPDPSVVRAVDGTHSHYFNLDALDCEQVTNRFNDPLRQYMNNAAVWSLAVRPAVHERLIERALDEKIRGILVEKPLADDLDTLEGLVERTEEAGLITGVNYIELVHPVYEAIVGRAVDERFEPGRGFHWRSKDLRYQVGEGKKFEGGVPFIKDNLGHDVSEVYGLYRALNEANHAQEITPELLVTDVSDFEFWADTEYREAYPFRGFENDIGAEVKIAGEDGAEFTLRGSYNDEEERRFFFWVDRHEKSAYYGNTLQREFTMPSAYKIVGKENIQEAETELREGSIVTKSEETDLMNRVNAKPISFPQAASNERVTRMCRRIFSNSPPASLRDGLNIERVLEQAYEQAGYPDAAKY